MKKFIAIYHSTPEAMSQWMNATEEQKAAGMKPWMDWQAKNQAHVVDFGAPVMGAIKMNADGSAEAIVKSVSGYSVLQGDTMEQIQGILGDHPHNNPEHGITIEVHESIAM